MTKKNELEIVKRRRYNRLYRKSYIFISAWAIRIIYFFLFIIVILFYDISKGWSDEILLSKKTETYITHTKRGVIETTKLYFETNYHSYTANISRDRPPEMYANDTINIERNIFGKSIYYSKADWGLKYALEHNFTLYYIILFFTMISFFFNDGLDPFTNKILWVIYSINFTAIAYFFCF